MNFSQLGWASGGPRSASGQISIVIRACNEDDDYDNNGDDGIGNDDVGDDDDDIYIMMSVCLFVCLSRKMITSSRK